MREMLERVLSPKGAKTKPLRITRLARWLRGLVPLRWRNWVKTALPMAIQDQLTLFWRTGGLDWSSTRAFVPFGDLEGYVRINLRGREVSGIVEPGEEFENLCAEIIDGLLTFVDEDTGEPIVTEVKRMDEVFPDGPMRHLLPDLIVRWSPHPAAKHRRIVSAHYGSIPWPTPGYPAQGRSGNHWPDGFLLARGESIPASRETTAAHILDLAPTILDLLDASVPAQMSGRPLFGSQKTKA
jgi:predicted AlkP superfamily phosphohydrolase/phosphomutase